MTNYTNEVLLIKSLSSVLMSAWKERYRTVISHIFIATDENHYNLKMCIFFHLSHFLNEDCR